jgi:hydroxymethylglutaryl-CoA reductase (NADPH)
MPDPTDLAERVREGDLRLYELDDHADAETAAAARRLVVERDTGADLGAVADYTFDAATADSNVENMLGAAQVPLGVAGPVPVNTSEAGDSDETGGAAGDWQPSVQSGGRPPA